MNRNLLLITPLAALALVGCGGASKTSAAPAPATTLSYADPNSPAGEWKLVKDRLSTSTHLILDLVGPSDGTKYRGVGFTLQADPAKVKFAQLADPTGAKGYLLDGGVFRDKDGSGADVAPTLQAGGIKADKLMVGIFQKKDDGVFGPQGSTAKTCDSVILKVAIDLDPSLKAFPGHVPLAVLKTRVIPEKIDAFTNRKLQDAKLNVGTLLLN